MQYFNGFKTVEEIKKRFANLAADHHPALGGDAATFGAIHAEYLAALKLCDGQMSKGSDNKEHRYFFNGVTEAATADQLGKLLGLKMPGVVVALIGTWLWVRGETKDYKESLKGLGCRWSGDKSSWYWHQGTYRKRGKTPASFQGMAAKYGYREFTNEDRA